MPQLPSVLIVAPRADEREVLCTVLARRGLRIWEASQAAEGLALAREHRPDVIIVDADCDAAGADNAAVQFGQARAGQQPLLVILGGVGHEALPRASHVIAKPYHYGPLIHRIEELAAKSKAA